jgi:hypothetical protein
MLVTRLRAGSAAFVVLALIACLAAGMRAAEGDLRLPDLDGRLVNPLAVPPGTKALVALFVSVECPVSNRYAPELQRIEQRFGNAGVKFLLIYPNPMDSPEKIDAHVNDFRHPGRVLRDPDHAFAKLAGVSVTPEAAVFGRDGTLVYRGRIDDRYVRIGLERPAPTRRDLVAGIEAAVAGGQADPARTDAVGCFIADFVHVH